MRTVKRTSAIDPCVFLVFLFDLLLKRLPKNGHALKGRSQRCCSKRVYHDVMQFDLRIGAIDIHICSAGYDDDTSEGCPLKKTASILVDGVERSPKVSS